MLNVLHPVFIYIKKIQEGYVKEKDRLKRIEKTTNKGGKLGKIIILLRNEKRFTLRLINIKSGGIK